MNALMKAARDGDLNALREALKDPNIDPNAQDEITGLTALHIAAAWRNTACTHALLSHKKIQSTIKDNFGRRPIDIFVSTNTTLTGAEIQQFLLDAHHEHTL